MRRKIFKLSLIIVFIAALTAGGVFFWYHSQTANPASGSATPTRIEVAEGENFLDFASKLDAAGGLTNLTALKVYLRMNNLEPSILAGIYDVPLNLTFSEILDLVQKGPRISTIRVTIPEGLRTDEIADRLHSAYRKAEQDFERVEFMRIVNKPDSQSFTSEVQDFLDKYKPEGKSLEGFLFPDTYIIGADASEKEVVELLVSTLISRLEANNIDPDAKTRVKDFYAALTLATITEREANNLNDMKIVSDIFLRRMENGWVLGADAPLLYPIKNWRHELTIQEIADSSNPYNTRQRLGLPPTPIANPGINGIVSVYKPKPNPYFYFISAGGKNYYAVTSAEHEANIAQYLN